MKADNLYLAVKVKMKISMWGAIKWRLMGFDKKDIDSYVIGDKSVTKITETTTTEEQVEMQSQS